MKPLFVHQERGIEFIQERDLCAGLIWEPGTGKTRAIIETVKRLRVKNPNLKVLVVCSISLIERTWMEEIQKYSDFSFTNCHEEGIPEKPTDFMIINWESIRSRKGQWNQELNENLIALRKLISSYQVLAVLDESTKIKSYNSEITKTMLWLAPHFAGRIIMSGTPTPNSVLEWWPQVNFIKPYVLGTSYHQFKNTYSYWERNGVKIPQGAVITRAERSKMYRTGGKEVVSAENEKKIMKLISPYLMVVQKKDCPDLPEKIDLFREVNMTSNQSRVYKDMKNELVAYLSDLFENQDVSSAAVAQNALTKIAKLREVTSGFIIDENGQEVDLGGSPKIQALEEIVEDAEGQQIIVFGNFKWELRKIASTLEKHGPVSLLYGETKDKAGVIEAFQKKDTRFFVAHPRSAAHGLNLQEHCSMAVFFSLSYSSEEYDQARARIHRQGQTQKCTYIHLLAKKTIDEEILSVVQGKKTAQQIILDLIPRRVAA